MRIWFHFNAGQKSGGRAKSPALPLIRAVLLHIYLKFLLGALQSVFAPQCRGVETERRGGEPRTAGRKLALDIDVAYQHAAEVRHVADGTALGQRKEFDGGKDH